MSCLTFYWKTYTAFIHVAQRRRLGLVACSSYDHLDGDKTLMDTEDLREVSLYYYYYYYYTVNL